jgi:hypothetical protein
VQIEAIDPIPGTGAVLGHAVIEKRSPPSSRFEEISHRRGKTRKMKLEGHLIGMECQASPISMQPVAAHRDTQLAQTTRPFIFNLRNSRYAYVRCTSTKAMRLTPLQASTRFPSRVAIMLRATPPPEGIGHVRKVALFGSKRTRVLGFVPDSLYHTMSFNAAIP